MSTTKVLLTFVLCLGLIAQGASQIDCKGGRFYDPLNGLCVQTCTANQNIDVSGKNCRDGCGELEVLVDGRCVC